jgi:hypothetical protein
MHRYRVVLPGETKQRQGETQCCCSLLAHLYHATLSQLA